MKKIFLINIFAVVALSVAAQSFDIEQYKLNNGLKVCLIEYGDVPATYISLYINCGKRNETPGQQQLSQIAASCVNFGCEKYDRTALQDSLFPMGTGIEAFAGDNFTTISSSFLNKDLDKGMDLYSNAILHPTFPEKEINQMISQLVNYNNPAKLDITQQADIFSRFWVYGASNPIGRYFYKNQLLKITPAAIKEFYQFNYTPANSRLMICGKLDKEKLKPIIEKYFGAWTAPYGEVNGASFESPEIKKKEYAFVNRNNATQAALHWTKVGPDQKSKDVIAFLIANSALNEALEKEIREEEGKTYGISSSYDFYSCSNLITISTQVRDEEMLNTISLFDKVLQNFYTNGVTQLDMDKAKKHLRNEWLMIEDPASLISFFNPIISPKPETRNNYIGEVDNTTLADVNKAVKKYFTTNAYKLMIAGDYTILKEQLDKLPGLKVFSPNDIETDQ